MLLKTPTHSVKGQLPGREMLPTGMPRKFLTFSFFLFLATLLIYLGMSAGYKAFLNNEISNLKDDIEELRFQISPDQQDNMVKFFSQVENTKGLLDDHVIASKLFPILEANTHSKVAYKTMAVSVPDNKIEIEGVAESYDALVSQMAIFKAVPQIRNVVLESSERNGDIVKFNIAITVVPELFKFSEL